jgi:hypothetical protein
MQRSRRNHVALMTQQDAYNHVRPADPACFVLLLLEVQSTQRVPLTAGQQAVTFCGVPDGDGSGFSTGRQMALRQQAPGNRLGKKAQLTSGSVQGVGAVAH